MAGGIGVFSGLGQGCQRIAANGRRKPHGSTGRKLESHRVAIAKAKLQGIHQGLNLQDKSLGLGTTAIIDNTGEHTVAAVRTYGRAIVENVGNRLRSINDDTRKIKIRDTFM